MAAGSRALASVILGLALLACQVPVRADHAPNRALAEDPSPYLRLHADDPVPLLLQLQRESKADSILFVQPRLEAFESGSGSAGRRLLRAANLM